MYESPIPLVAYVLVGFTSSILAIVSVMDKQPSSQNSNSSATSMLPSIGSVPVAEPIAQPVVGGKKNKTHSKKHKNNKTTKKN
jgi:hypothetical protein